MFSTQRASISPIFSTNTASYLESLSNVSTPIDRKTNGVAQETVDAPSPDIPNSILRPLISPVVRRKKKTAIIETLYNLRRSRSNDPTLYDSYLDSLLKEIDTPLPAALEVLPKAPLPYPFVLPSHRVSLNLLRSVLDLTTPPVDDTDDAYAIRRQTLAVTLNQCKNRRGGIHSVYREARRKASRLPSMEEMIKRTPEGLETPKYEVVFQADLTGVDAYEIRRYDGYAVVSTTKKEDSAPASGFNLLAGYIFGKNRSNEKMSMTTPVFMSGSDNSGAENASAFDRKMSFVLPSTFWSQEKVTESPEPAEGSSLSRTFVEPVLRGVVWFSGLTTPAKIREQEENLERLIQSSGGFKVKDGASFVQASYNDPFTAPWKRRNEIMIEVEKMEA
eukprot:CAMPEP_0113315622 /NCGR_PEP_ID=MMETSP0010_2-20120614/11218_1 /TAXON_ID=216773 ORGANISM="Corethron hystrix, Strain 308" /NCGR_SAMPLE_ID=MMETSP0010_2 /ASSEMBLY_ACC=CAM_ASM_000155 /LENGTH=389 /DNA_ID=CAMNT_0000172163 /DNA_START=259 /DNA_END=1428 /DNA_ORIENTATION=- /assembly_acc=CAM_ASM_000155